MDNLNKLIRLVPILNIGINIHTGKQTGGVVQWFVNVNSMSVGDISNNNESLDVAASLVLDELHKRSGVLIAALRKIAD